MSAIASNSLRSLAGLVPDAQWLRGDDSLVPRRAVADSRSVGPGDLFVALAADAERCDAHLREAVARGAVAVASRFAPDLPCGVLRSAQPGRFLARAAEQLEGNPTSSLRCVGVTGTNGKTTTTRLIEQALLTLGERPALIGTGVMRAPGLDEPSVFTTPFGDVISAFARRARDAGATHLVMEVSSHALEQHRADGVAFEVAAFTNLTRDHLDYHGTMDAYGAAKARLFTELHARRAVLHVGDAFGAALARRLDGAALRVAVEPAQEDDAELVARDVRYGRDGLVATVRFGDERSELTSPLVGRHNLENLLVALGCLRAMGVPLADATRALASATGAEGRLERVPDASIGVFVDYAHTPDAIARVLGALRPATPGRLWVVFGCGGDRDRGKRPAMAAAACELADLVIVTSDNPRTEEPGAIVADVLAGIDRARRPELHGDALATARVGHLVVLDRREAIRAAIAAAAPGDTVLLAGKGHEDYQIVGTTKHPFDDRVEARKALALRRRDA